MNEDFVTAEQIAEKLGLHVRTVRNYIREGRLKAVRIGKQYRITREDLKAFMGLPELAPVRRERHVEVSSIVEIDAISPEAANRLSNGLLAAAKNPNRDQSLHIETIYNEVRGHLKIIVTGSLATTGGFLQLINVYLEG
jgi:excisionase family DNA binding protein